MAEQVLDLRLDRRDVALRLEGAVDCEAMKIGQQLDRLGASLSVRSGLDLTTVSLSALKPNLDPTLALFADVC